MHSSRNMFKFLIKANFACTLETFQIIYTFTHEEAMHMIPIAHV